MSPTTTFLLTTFFASFFLSFVFFALFSPPPSHDQLLAGAQVTFLLLIICLLLVVCLFQLPRPATCCSPDPWTSTPKSPVRPILQAGRGPDVCDQWTCCRQHKSYHVLQSPFHFRGQSQHSYKALEVTTKASLVTFVEVIGLVQAPLSHSWYHVAASEKATVSYKHLYWGNWVHAWYFRRYCTWSRYGLVDWHSCCCNCWV